MYIFIGGLTTAVNWIVYSVMMISTVIMKVPGSAESVMTAANAVAWAAAAFFAFFANKIFVFRSKSFAPRTFIKEVTSFFGARLLSGAIEVFAPTWLYDAGLDMPLFGIEGGIAKLAVSAAVIVLNYVFSKLVVFKDQKKGDTV